MPPRMPDSGQATPHLPPLPTVATIQRRLALIFPEGTPNRVNAIAERAAKTAFVMLYVGAVGDHALIRPDQVTRMTDEQAAKSSDDDRSAWLRRSMKAQDDIVGRWYSTNSREGIRDDTLRYAWQPLGAVIEQDLPTTSSKPRWSLALPFAALLTWGITAADEPADLQASEQSELFIDLIRDWQRRHLSASALTRVTLLKKVTGTDASVEVVLPGIGKRQLAPGSSSLIVKELIESFVPKFLTQPFVVWLSESSEHVPVVHEELARRIGLDMSSSGILPDVVLVDLGESDDDFLLLFVEIVATDGPINEERKALLLGLATRGNFKPSQVAFLTAFADRSAQPFKKLSDCVAWNTFSWTASEPDKLTIHHDASGSTAKLSRLVQLLKSDA